MTVGPIATSPALVASAPPPAPTDTSSGTVALPEPATATNGDYNNAMAMLYTLVAQQGANAMKSGDAEVTFERDQQVAAQKAQSEAMAREERADGQGSKGFFASVGGLVHDVASDTLKLHLAAAVEVADTDVVAAYNSPNFWKDVEFGATKVAQVAAIVGSVAESVATFGAGSVGAVAVVALVLSSASMAESDFHVLEKCGVNANVATYVGAGCALGGAVMGGIGALTSSAQKLGTLAAAAKAAGSAVQAADGGAAVVSGAAHVKNGDFAADAEDANADATAAGMQIKSAQWLTNMIVDGLKDVSESTQRALQSLQGAMKTNTQSILASGRVA